MTGETLFSPPDQIGFIGGFILNIDGVAPQLNVLITRCLSSSGPAKLTNDMPIDPAT